jgi:hypothetical protein
VRSLQGLDFFRRAEPSTATPDAEAAEDTQAFDLRVKLLF